MQSHSPTRLKLILVLPGKEEWESYLHQMFEQDNHHDEWFYDSPELKSFIGIFMPLP